MSAWGQGGAAKSCNYLLSRVERNDPQLTELVILPSKTFGDVELHRLANAIDARTKKNDKLASLSASGHSVTSSSLSALGVAIASRPNGGVTRLAVGDSSLGDDGVAALCEPLVETKGGGLVAVDLGLKGLSPRGATAIGTAFALSPTLQQLNLSRNEQLGDEGFINLHTAALSLTTTTAIDSPLSTVYFPSLDELNVSKCSISVKGMQALAQTLVSSHEETETQQQQRRTIGVLTLDGNPLGPEGATALAPLLSPPVVKSLSAKDCDIGDDGLLSLSNAIRYYPSQSSSPSITSLNLSHNGLSVKGLDALLRHPSFASCTELILSGNPLGDEGIVTLCEILPRHLPNVTTLDLSRTTTTTTTISKTNNKGLSIGIVAVLRCQQLTHLRFFDNQLGDEGWRAMMEATTTTSEDNNDASSPPLLSTCSLVELDLGGNKASSEVTCQFLKKLSLEGDSRFLKRLTVLEMGGNQVGEEGETMLNTLGMIRPNLDVARDRPTTETNDG